MRKVVSALVVTLALSSAAHAADWPTRTITMINPFAAGGPNDVVARLFAQRMGEILGQSVIIENVGGAGGMNGADRVAKAAPDGYTFLLGTVGTFVTDNIRVALEYNNEQDYPRIQGGTGREAEAWTLRLTYEW